MFSNGWRTLLHVHQYIPLLTKGLFSYRFENWNLILTIIIRMKRMSNVHVTHFLSKNCIATCTFTIDLFQFWIHKMKILETIFFLIFPKILWKYSIVLTLNWPWILCKLYIVKFKNGRMCRLTASKKLNLKGTLKWYNWDGKSVGPKNNHSNVFNQVLFFFMITPSLPSPSHFSRRWKNWKSLWVCAEWVKNLIK